VPQRAGYEHDVLGGLTAVADRRLMHARDPVHKHVVGFADQTVDADLLDAGMTALRPIPERYDDLIVRVANGGSNEGDLPNVFRVVGGVVQDHAVPDVPSAFD